MAQPMKRFIHSLTWRLCIVGFSWKARELKVLNIWLSYAVLPPLQLVFFAVRSSIRQTFPEFSLQGVPSGHRPEIG